MSFANITPIAGKPYNPYVNAVDTVQVAQLGTVIGAVDPYFGYAEFMYVQFPASAAITIGQVLVLSGIGATVLSAAVATNAANTGRSIVVAVAAVASVASIQHGWVQLTGNAVLKAAASVAAGTTFGIDVTTGGSVAANSAGRQVLSAVSVAASTNTVVKNAVLTNGSPIIRVADSNGWVPGLTVSGTGVSGTILSVDPDNRTVTLSANASAGGNSSVTATYTGFIIGQINRSNLQGATT